jgi:hypothetical protein
MKKLTLLSAATALVLGSTAISANAQTKAPGAGWVCSSFEYANRCNAVLRPPYRRCECLGAPTEQSLSLFLTETGARPSAAVRGGP